MTKYKYNIKTFKTPLNYYVYSANNNGIKRISEDMYNTINKHLLNSDQLPLEILSEIACLEKVGILTQDTIENLECIPKRNIEYYLNYRINTLIFQVTQNCNFHCAYCIYSPFNNEQQRNMSSKRMSWEVAKDAIDFLYTHSGKSESINMSFYGGEPLLEYALIKKIITYTNEKFLGRKVNYDMTTNASLLTDESIDYLADNNVRLLISLDGPKKIHNKHRRFWNNGEGTYDIVINNIKKIAERKPEYFKLIRINMVVDPRDNYLEINDLFSEIAMKRENVLSALIDDDYALNKVSFSEKYITEHNYEQFLGYLYTLRHISEQEISYLSSVELEKEKIDLQNLSSEKMLSLVKAHGGPCIPGYTRLFVNCDGELFPCERVSELSACMNLGNIYDGFDMEKVNKMIEASLLIQTNCINCWNIHMCKQCAKTSEANGEFSAKAKKSYCNRFRAQTEKVIKLYLMYMELNECNYER